MPADVLLLGSYGLAGRAILDALLARGLSVVAAGRRIGPLREAVAGAVHSRGRGPEPSVSAMAIDAARPEDVAAGLARCRVVVNAVGPYLLYGRRIADQARSAGVHYLDIASEDEHRRRLAASGHGRPAGRTSVVGTGWGLYPGVSGLAADHLLRQVERPRSVEVWLAMGANPAGGGTAQTLTGILEMAHPLREMRGGRWRRVVPGTTVTRMMPAPFGAQSVMVWPQLEVPVLAGRYDLRDARSGISAHGQTVPRWYHAAVVRLLRPDLMAWSRRLLQRIAHASASTTTSDPTPTAAGAVVRVCVRGCRETRDGWIRSDDTERATAVLPALAAEMLLRGTVPGSDRGRSVVTPLEVLSLTDILPALRAAGVDLGGDLPGGDERRE